MKAKVHAQESARLSALRAYNVLDTPTEKAYDDLTALAAFICNVPIALISLIEADRQWFKSKVGISASETPRDVSFCAHAILEKGIMVIEDARRDERFADNPLVTCTPDIRFYAGIPLLTPEGYPLGTLCVIDQQPNNLSRAQITALEALARQVVALLELSRVSAQLAGALEKIDSMGGLIPICAHCKGVRDDEGYWATVEEFIAQHSDVAFTHSVCDRCMQAHYPEAVKLWQATHPAPG
ncbi:MAG: GAF domain-containing protein [Phormidesmis sp.]